MIWRGVELEPGRTVCFYVVPVDYGGNVLSEDPGSVDDAAVNLHLHGIEFSVEVLDAVLTRRALMRGEPYPRPIARLKGKAEWEKWRAENLPAKGKKRND